MLAHGVVIAGGHVEARVTPVTRVEAGIGNGHPPRGGEDICDVRNTVMINYSFRDPSLSHVSRGQIWYPAIKMNGFISKNPSFMRKYDAKKYG